MFGDIFDFVSTVANAITQPSGFNIGSSCCSHSSRDDDDDRDEQPTSRHATMEELITAFKAGQEDAGK